MQHGQTTQIGQFTYRADVLSNIFQMLEYMTTKHNKVFVVRIDIHFPQSYPSSNEPHLITEFFRRLMSFYRYHGIFAVYYSAREQNISSNPHYHFYILFDGNKIDNGWGVRQKAASIWQGLIGSHGDACIHLCETYEGASGIMIRRPTPEIMANPGHPVAQQFAQTKQTVLTWLSYLAKTATKGNCPAHTKEFRGSRFK